VIAKTVFKRFAFEGEVIKGHALYREAGHVPMSWKTPHVSEHASVSARIEVGRTATRSLPRPPSSRRRQEPSL
jgi:hypothetical protein